MDTLTERIEQGLTTADDARAIARLMAENARLKYALRLIAETTSDARSAELAIRTLNDIALRKENLT